MEIMEELRGLNSRSRDSERDKLKREQSRRKREEIEDTEILDFLYKPANRSQTSQPRVNNAKTAGVSFITPENRKIVDINHTKNNAPTYPNTSDFEKSSGVISRQPANRSSATQVSVEIADNQEKVGGNCRENEGPINTTFSSPETRSEKRKKRLSVLGTRWGLKTFRLCRSLVGERSVDVVSSLSGEAIPDEKYVRTLSPSENKAASNESKLVSLVVTENQESIEDSVPVKTLISLLQDGDSESGFLSSGEPEVSANERVTVHIQSPIYFLEQPCYEILAKSPTRVKVGTSSHEVPGQNRREENLEISSETANQNIGTEHRISEPERVRKMKMRDICEKKETPVVQTPGALGESRKRAKKRLTSRQIRGYKEKAHANKSGCCTVLGNTVASFPEADKIHPEILECRISRRADPCISGIKVISNTSSEEDSVNNTVPDAESTRRFSDPESVQNAVVEAPTSVKGGSKDFENGPEPWPPP